MHYFHIALEEFFENVLGIVYADVLHKRNVSLPTVHLESDFIKRLKFGDRIEMEVRVLHVGKSSIKWGYRAGDNEDLVIEGNNVTVCVRNDTFEKINVPEWLREALQNYQSSN